MARRRSNAKTNVRLEARKAGFRSGFEHMLARQLESDGIRYLYEPKEAKIAWTPKVSKYLPDFVLENGIIIEAKGRFTGKDRTKHEQIKAQYPELDIRFIFQVDNPIVTGSKTRYSDWCDKRGFIYAFGSIPREWANEE